MTQGIDDFFNLPHMDEVLKANGVDPKTSSPVPEVDEEEDMDSAIEIAESIDFMKAAEQKLTHMEGTDHAKAMDEIHRETLDHSRNLMDLAYNVDDRARRGILEIATSMYKNAIDAKNSKREMQLKVMKLMQDQQKIDLDHRKFRAEIGEEIIESKATIVEDRNELIKRIRAHAKEEKQTPPEK